MHMSPPLGRLCEIGFDPQTCSDVNPLCWRWTGVQTSSANQVSQIKIMSISSNSKRSPKLLQKLSTFQKIIRNSGLDARFYMPSKRSPKFTSIGSPPAELEDWDEPGLYRELMNLGLAYCFVCTWCREMLFCAFLFIDCTEASYKFPSSSWVCASLGINLSAYLEAACQLYILLFIRILKRLAKH